jgi:hypothetical protein
MKASAPPDTLTISTADGLSIIPERKNSGAAFVYGIDKVSLSSALEELVPPAKINHVQI